MCGDGDGDAPNVQSQRLCCVCHNLRGFIEVPIVVVTHAAGAPQGGGFESQGARDWLDLCSGR